MKWLFNIPYENVPEGFSLALPSRAYDYEGYLGMAQTLNGLPNYWNMALVDDSGTLMMFSWGMYDLLEKFVYVLRVSKHPSLLSYQADETADSFISNLKAFAQALGCERVFWIADKWRALEKKLDGIAYVNDKARVMELY